MVGHQDESQHIDMKDTRQNGDQIHARLEIILIPEPDSVRQMIRGNQPEFQTILQNAHISRTLKIRPGSSPCLHKYTLLPPTFQIFFPPSLYVNSPR